jgi:hypothetical protein
VALLADDLPEHENSDLQHAVMVIDLLDLANLVLDNSLLVFSVSATDNLCTQTLCLLDYIALLQPSPCNKPLDLAKKYQTYPWTNIFQECDTPIKNFY